MLHDKLSGREISRQVCTEKVLSFPSVTSVWVFLSNSIVIELERNTG
jgi:hypothetical protein